MGSGGGSGIEWMLSIGGIGVDAPEASGGGLRVSSAIVMVAIEGGLLECSVVVNAGNWKIASAFGMGLPHASRDVPADGASSEMHDAPLFSGWGL